MHGTLPARRYQIVNNNDDRLVTLLRLDHYTGPVSQPSIVAESSVHFRTRSASIHSQHSADRLYRTMMTKFSNLVFHHRNTLTDAGPPCLVSRTLIRLVLSLYTPSRASKIIYLRLPHPAAYLSSTIPPPPHPAFSGPVTERTSARTALAYAVHSYR